MDKNRLQELAGMQTLTEAKVYDREKWNNAVSYLAKVAIEDAKEALQDLSPEEIKRDILKTAKGHADDAAADIHKYISQMLKTKVK